MTTAESQCERWLAAARSALQTTSAAPIDTLECVDAGIQHRRSLDDERGSLALRDTLVRMIAQLQYHALEQIALRLRSLSAESDSLRADVSDHLEQWLRRDEVHAAQLLSAAASADGYGVFQCDSFEADLQWYSLIAAHLEGEPEPDRAYAVQSRLDHLSRSIADIPLSPNATEATRRHCRELLRACDELHRSYLKDRIADEVEYPLGAASPLSLWNRRFQLSRLEGDYLAIHSAGVGLPDDPDSSRAVAAHSPGESVDVAHSATATTTLDARREELASLAEERLDMLQPSEREHVCQELALAAREESNDLLALCEDEPLPIAVERLRMEVCDLRRLARTGRRVSHLSSPKAGKQPADVLTKTAVRLLRRTRNELQEKKLSLRMERLFGRTAVAWIENTVMALIVVLTSLILTELALDSVGRLTPALRALFAWADLAICSIFLGEFFLKVSLAEGRLRYFRRHFVVDFLASIPYGFLTHGLGRIEIVGEEAGLLRLLRFLRLPQFARYIRMAQPMIRAGRLLFFLLRTMDRLVRKHAAVFNQNILLFQPRAIGFEEHAYRMRLARMREHFSQGSRQMEQNLSPQARLARVELSLAELRVRYECLPTTAVPEPMPRSSYGREIPAEEVIRELIEMTPERLVQRMGPGFPETLARYVRFFDLPLVRRLPMLRTLIAARDRGAGEVAALAANQMGYLLQGVLNVGYFLADLHGTISGPIFLDRLGTLLVSATARNAKRLILIGTIFVILYAFVRWLGVNWLKGLFSTIQSIFGLPLLILGGICLVVMLLGRWLKSLANQASEAGERLVEAQFAAQTKTLKARYIASDLCFLADRVITPELVLRSSDDVDAKAKPLGVSAQSLLERAAQSILPSGLFGDAERFDVSQLGDELLFLRTVALLHHDYLDSGLFRPTDTKTTTQLLGNLALANLRRSNIADLLDGRRLRALDLSRSSGSLFGGPYMWFNYMTRIITEETAKRIIDFNRHAIPLSRLACAPAETRDRYRDWVARRLGIPASSVPLPQSVGEFGNQPALASDTSVALAQPAFESVDFTTMDFLLHDPRRDSDIEQKYGPLVLKLVRDDRKRGLRRAFRSFPLHRFAASERTLNPFTLYLDYCSGGRVLLLPLRIVWLALKGMGLFVRQIWRTVQELLNPPAIPHERIEEDSFAIALRKIHRMRKPGFVASLWLRARLDVEYLGIPIPGAPLAAPTGAKIEDDLNFIGSTRRERLAAELIATSQRRRLNAMLPTLTALGVQADTLPEFLSANYPHLAHRSAEVMRALTMAWVTDYEGLASLAASIDGLRRFIPFAARLDHDGAAIPDGLPDSVKRRVGRGRLQARSNRPALRGVLARLGFSSLDETATRRVLRMLRRHWPLVRGWVGTIQALPAGPDVFDILGARIREVILRTDLWSDQIVVLRTLQSLTVLDVYHYCRMVWNLGGYGDRDGEEFPARLPMSHEPFDWSDCVSVGA